MDNFARAKFDSKVNNKVKEELEIANIPIISLPCFMNTEVKTDYIGYLNGFVFYRAWTYWICLGKMPLEIAKEIYQKYQKLNIRAGGHAGNVEPESQSMNPVYEKEITDLLKNTNNTREYLEKAEKIVDDKTLPRYVDMYNIDTQLGLCKLTETIKAYDIHTENALLLND